MRSIGRVCRQIVVALRVRGCVRGTEIVVPRYARLLFALSQFWPGLGDWLIRRYT